MPLKSIYKYYKPVNRPNHENNDYAYWFIFNNNNMLVFKQKDHIPFLNNLKDLDLHPVIKIYIGTLKDHPCYAVEVETSNAPKVMSFHDLRDLYNIIDKNIYLLAGRAIQIINWDKNHQFCGKCGSKTENMDNEMAKICPNCGFSSYTRISPAVITAIIKDGKLLMAHHSRSTSKRYGLIAGFVEAGETLEEAVQRETMEEVGLKVKNIKYFSSQPWPFPHSLMVGFTADYESGNIKVDGDEITHAKWFNLDNLPELPSEISIAHDLILWYKNKYSNILR